MLRVGQSSVTPVRMANAGIGATSPAEMIEAALEAAVWLMLFSSSPQGGTRSPRVRRAAPQKPMLSRAAAIDILNDQPIFSPE